MSEIIGVFDLLDEWRELPTYQLERRADIYFARYLPIILKKHPMIGVEIKYGQIFPEFPLEKIVSGNKPEKIMSTKVDYAVFGQNCLYLIELKTDMRSRNRDQDERLTRVKEKGFADYIKDVFEIIGPERKNKEDQAKYDTLIERLKHEGITSSHANKREIKIIYIQPWPSKKQLCELNETIYIYFCDIADYISESAFPDERFCKSLRIWGDKRPTADKGKK